MNLKLRSSRLRHPSKDNFLTGIFLRDKINYVLPDIQRSSVLGQKIKILKVHCIEE